MTRVERERLREALNALLHAIDSGMSERFAIISINKRDASESMIVIGYPLDERQAFRAQLLDIIGANMGDS